MVLTLRWAGPSAPQKFPVGRPSVANDFKRPCQIFQVPMMDGDRDPGGICWGANPLPLLVATNSPLIGSDTPHVAIFVRTKHARAAREMIAAQYPEIKWIQP